MKKILLTLAAAASVVGAFAADGTFLGSNLLLAGRQNIFDVDGTTKVPKANGAVEFLFNGAAVGAGTYAFTGAGLFSVGTIGIPNEAGQTVSLTIDIWDTTTGATYAAAKATGKSFTETIQVTLGGGGNPAGPAVELSNFKGGNLVLAPEPSTIALAALGLGGLLFIGRRK